MAELQTTVEDRQMLTKVRGGKTYSLIGRFFGVAASTMFNWEKGRTTIPQNVLLYLRSQTLCSHCKGTGVVDKED